MSCMCNGADTFISGPGVAQPLGCTRQPTARTFSSEAVACTLRLLNARAPPAATCQASPRSCAECPSRKDMAEPGPQPLENAPSTSTSAEHDMVASTSTCQWDPFQRSACTSGGGLRGCLAPDGAEGKADQPILAAAGSAHTSLRSATWSSSWTTSHLGCSQCRFGRGG